MQHSTTQSSELPHIKLIIVFIALIGALHIVFFPKYDSFEDYARKSSKIPADWLTTCGDGKYISAYLFSSPATTDQMLCVFEKSNTTYDRMLFFTSGFSHYKDGIYVYMLPKAEWLIFSLGECNIRTVDVFYDDHETQTYNIQSPTFLLVIPSNYSNIVAKTSDGTPLPINIF